MREVIDLAPWLAAAHDTIKEKRRPRDKSAVANRLGSKSGSAPKPAPTARVSPSSAASAPDHRRRSGQTAAARAIPERELSQAIRAWGRANGHKVTAHGFLSPELGGTGARRRSGAICGADHQQVREELVMQYRETKVAAERRHRAFLGAVEVISRALLQASDARAAADVERMLDVLRQQVAALTPWADAHICTSCWRAIPPVTQAHPGRDHRGICATCWERRHQFGDPPSDADLWDGGDAILGEN